MNRATRAARCAQDFATPVPLIDPLVQPVVASAQAQVSASLALSLTSTVTDSASWYIPKNHKGPGRLYVGAATNWMNWNHYRQNGNCTVVRVGKGTANLPYDIPRFWHN